MINPTEEDIVRAAKDKLATMNGPLEEIAGYVPEAFPQGSMSEHERIWLEPAPGADEDYGRQWCQHNVWGDEATEYLLFPAWPQAIVDVAAERRRQIEVEGFDHKHDDTSNPDTMALAAAVYAIPDHYRFLDCEGFGSERGSLRRVLWPWDDEWFKPGDRRRELVKAAALIIAEIEAIDRANGAPAILEGLNGKRRSLDELTQHLDVVPAARRVFEVFCGGKVDWDRHVSGSGIFESADWAAAVSYARAALGIGDEGDAA
ncbi:hypothetical protein [Rhizobium leguminosarum]